MSKKLVGIIAIGAAALALIVWAMSGERRPADLPTNEQLVIGVGQEFESLNPITFQMAASSYLYWLTGRPLAVIDGDWKWTCWLCTEIPTLENGKVKIFQEDGKQKLIAEWEIIEGAVWGDGEPITARDIKLGWEVGKSPHVTTGNKETFTQIEEVIIDPENPRKFQLKHSEARYDYYHLARLSVLPFHIEGPIWERTKNEAGAYEKLTAYNTDPTNPGLASGPYYVSELKLGSHIIFDRNPNFYGDEAKIKRLIFRLIPNTQTLEANLLAGTIDKISELGINFDQAVALQSRIENSESLSNRFEVTFEDGMVYEHIDLNLRNPILQDVRVRKALVYAIDRQELVDALFGGKQHVALHSNNPRDPYYTEDVVLYEHAPAKAVELLEEAGWKLRDNGYRYKDGKRLRMSLMSTAQDKTRELIQVWLQREWKKIGIDIQIRNEPARVFFGETVRKGTYDAMAMFAWISSPDLPPRSILHTSMIPTAENGYSGQNSNAYRNDEVDRLLDAIRTEFNFDKRKEIMQQIMWHYTNDVGTIPLYLRSNIVVNPKNLTGFKMTGHQYVNTLSAEYWSLE